MLAQPLFVVQAYRRRRGGLSLSETYLAMTEDAVFRRGRAMQARVDGLLFFKISRQVVAEGRDDLELLAATGDVPSEAGGSATSP